MKNFIKICLITLIFSNLFYAQEERNVLVEVFTNSHCPLCPPGHNALIAYNQSSPNAENINYIFYHMRYPYNDDALYQANTSDSQGRDLYYGPFGSTPKAFFDGMIQQNNYSSWGSILDQQVMVSSPLKIFLTGTKESGIININAEIMRSGNTSENDLVIHFIVVENTFYQGRNGITNHKNVMRKMVTSPTGESFNINANETKQVQKNISISDSWIPDSLGVVVFIQSSSSKVVYQSAFVSYSELSDVTGVDRIMEIPSEYSLEQNYPNPFNPSTTISFNIPSYSYVSLKIFDLLGKEVATIVSEELEAGNYKREWNAKDFSSRISAKGGFASGVYFYRLQAGDPQSGQVFISTKKLILLK